MLSRIVNILLILFISGVLYAQADSLKCDISFSSYILPLAMITAGSVISGSDFEKDIQADVRSSVGEDFEFGIDDYIQYVPVAELYLAKMIGIKSKNNFWQMSKYLGIANLTSVSVVWALKTAIDKTRPNGARYSFPSGHTNFAFTNATVLYHEYKDSNAFVAYSGFAFASTTGAYRIMNNKHWTSDVLAGAGLGILVGNLVYQFEPLKNWHPFGLGAENNITIFPSFENDQYGLIMTVNFKE